VNDLLDTINDKNKKISELENSNTRYKLIKEQVNEAAAVKSKEDVKDKDDIDAQKVAKKVKCRFDNTGKCRRSSECKDVHPKKTCQSHSKLGSCPMESTCEHRHPYGVCYEWEKYGACDNGDGCRHRHPFDLARHASSGSNHFLGNGSPGRQGGPGGQGQGHPRPGKGHQDQRGNRW
jgi:hypothetical protein